MAETRDLGALRLPADAIIAFASRYDPQPQHLDPEAARQTVLGGLCASGWQTGVVMQAMARDLVNRELPGARLQMMEALQWKAPVYADTPYPVTAEIKHNEDHTINATVTAVTSEAKPAAVLSMTYAQGDPSVVGETVHLRDRSEAKAERHDLAIGETAFWGEIRLDEPDIKDFRAAYDPLPAGERLSASPWHLACLWMRINVESLMARAAEGSYGFSPGLRNLQALHPAEPGDVLHIQETLIERRASRSMPGWEVIEAENILLNERDQPVLSFIGAYFGSSSDTISG